MECCKSVIRRTPDYWRIRHSSLQCSRVICVFILCAGWAERSPEVFSLHSTVTLFISVECILPTYCPLLVKQHAKSCLPPAAACEDCFKFEPLFLPGRPSMSFLIMFLCEQGQGCWHRPSVISLTRHCHEQTRRDHPTLCSISLSQGNSFSPHRLTLLGL